MGKELYLKLDENKRIIVISDIHGNIDVFKQLLKKINYCDEDCLFILGDVINRGYQNLKTLYYIMELVKKENVYMISGNHEYDMTFNFTNFSDEEFARYSNGKTSLLRELLADCPYETRADKEKYILEKFHDIFAFFKELPLVVKTDKYIFAHAGYKEDDYQFMVKAFNFRDYHYSFKKWVIVGHFPTANYSSSYMCCNPLIDEKNKIIYIDGGNGVKSFGQVNALIIHDGFHFEYEDDFEKRIIPFSQKGNDPFTISFLDSEIKVLSFGEVFSLVEHVSTKKKGYIETRKIEKKDDKYTTFDATNCLLDIEKNDEVSVIYELPNHILAKKGELLDI